VPYRSAKQRAYLHIHHPGIAARWDREYGGKIVPSKKHKGRRMHHAIVKRLKG
jgi:hypothetical protein